MPLYQSHGLTLAYHEMGKGPALVLVHGWGANGREWDDFGWTAPLAADRRLLIPDVRGHGESARPHEVAAYRGEALAADMIALLETAGEEQADLFGYSMGASIALWTVVVAPDRVRSLVAGGVPGANPEDAAELGRAMRGHGPITERAARYRDDAAARGETDVQALGACLEAGIGPPPCPELALFGGEALLAAGDRDRRRELTERISGCLPGGRFVLLEGADHMGVFGDPRFHRAAREFLAEVSPP
jgi:pimeloyl-ACP methyl ester carboxylesterase